MENGLGLIEEAEGGRLDSVTYQLCVKKCYTRASETQQTKQTCMLALKSDLMWG